MNSTTDGKIYHMVICTCGKQDTSGKCQHVSDPVYIEYMPGREPTPEPIRFWSVR